MRYVFELHQRIEAALLSVLEGGSWKNEDTITFNVVSAIDAAPIRIPPDVTLPFQQIRTAAFVLTGRTEQERGDLAIIVRMKSGKKTLVGVAYLEAKKAGRGGQYTGMKDWRQFDLMRRVVPHHGVLLYDKEPRGTTGWLWDGSGSRCLYLPTNYVLALRTNAKRLGDHARPFSEQLWTRYIVGHDFEYDSCAVETAKGHVPSKYTPDYLLLIDTSGEIGTLIESINSDHWMRLKPQEESHRPNDDRQR